tara:strand:- start:63 stop:374 length:312 start_codon:yes stop_codon:yes gene_type:complete
MERIAKDETVGAVSCYSVEQYNRMWDTYDIYKVVSICDLVDHLFGTDWSKHPAYEETGCSIIRWCKENDAAYYSADRENFFIGAACDQAKTEGKSIVVVEDLS